MHAVYLLEYHAPGVMYLHTFRAQEIQAEFCAAPWPDQADRMEPSLVRGRCVKARSSIETAQAA